MKIITCICLIFLTSRFVQAQDQLLSKDQLQSDFRLFRTALEEVHPEMYRYTSKQTFDSLFEATKEQLKQPLSQQDFYKTMLPLVVALRDGHIKWIVAGQDQHYQFYNNNLFPLKLYFAGNRAWIVENYCDEKLPAGAEVISINQLPVASIVATLLPKMFFADGYSVNGNYHELNNFFSGYYAIHFGGHDQFTVTYRHGDEEKEVMLSAVSVETIKAHSEKHKTGNVNPFRLDIQDEKTALVTIERFWGNKKEYKAFLKEAFQQLKSQKIENLILDVRNNEGGNESFGILLYSYLAKSPFRYYDHISVNPVKDLSFPAVRPRNYKILRKLLVRRTDKGHVITGLPGLRTAKPQNDAFGGEVYVLVNGSSFSVTTEFSARAHADRRATFIGQETAGGYIGNSSGAFTIVQLPNSKIDLGIPMLGFHMANVPADLMHGQGIIPDFQLIPTIKDVLTRRDPELDFALKLIEEKTR